MRQRTKLAIAAAATGALTLGLCSPAHADEEVSDVMDALAAVSERAGTSPADTSDVLSRVADVETTENGEFAIDERVGATDVAIPTDPRDDLSLAVEHVGIEISIGLPFAEQADRATVEADGIVSYDNRNGTTTAAFRSPPSSRTPPRRPGSTTRSRFPPAATWSSSTAA